MNPQTAMVILALIEVMLSKGVPAYIEWQDGVRIEHPDIEQIRALQDIKRPEEF